MFTQWRPENRTQRGLARGRAVAYEDVGYAADLQPFTNILGTMNNPYSAPATQPDSGATGDGQVRCVGDLLVIPKGTKLPGICLFTGTEDGGVFETKKLSWAPPWVFIFILFNILILLVVYLIVRKQGELTFYTDASILARRKTVGWTWGGTMMAAVVAAVIGFATEVPVLGICSVLAFLVALIVLLVKFPKLKIAKIDKTDIHLKGIPPEVRDRIIERMYPH